MDNSRAPQNSNPPPLPPVDPYSRHHPLYPTPNFSSQYYFPQRHPENPNPNPNPNAPIAPLNQTHEPNSALRPPGVDPGSSARSHGAVHEPYDPALAYAQPGYYQDPNVINSLQNWAAEILRYYGSIPNATGVTIPPNGTQLLVAAQADPKSWTNATVRPHGHGTRKKAPKKTKIIQSVWCEVCRVECNTKDVLDKHKMGKKHNKNVEKLKQATIAPPPPVDLGLSVNPVIGPQENPAAASAVQKTRKKAAETEEDLETKRRKILEGGAAADAVRMCTICNVVCNSELVFAYHNAGKKHASMMMKKRVGGTGVTIAT